MSSTPQQTSPLVTPVISSVGLLSTGQALGHKLVKNDELPCAEGNEADDWIYQRSGIRQRYLADDLTTSDLACEAAQQCVQRSNINVHDIDLIMVTTLSPDQLVPAVANRVQDHLQISAGAMDIHSSCAGFVYGLVTAAQFIAAGGCEMVLLIGADTSSRFTDPADRNLHPLFGDGAGAVLLGKGQGDQGLLAFDLGSDGAHRDLIHVPIDSQPRLKMDGKRVFKWAVSKICQSVADVLARAGKQVEDVDKFVFHQANQRMLSSIARNLNVDLSKVVTNIEQVGNTANASIPLALHQAIDDGEIEPGDMVLLGGFGGGLSWSTALLSM